MAIKRKTRRGLLFGITLVTILLVIVGTVITGSFLEASPVGFVIYWSICFVSAMLVLGLAFVDMIKVKEEFRARQVELDAELAKIVSDAENLANENKRTETE